MESSSEEVGLRLPVFLLTCTAGYALCDKFLHYMRLSQFTSSNPVLIPWNQITLPFLPPLLPIPCHLLACEQGLCLGKRVKKTSWLFQITISPNRDPVHRLPFCRLLHRPRRILAFRAHQQAREDPLLPVWKRNKEIYFPRLLLAETQLIWQRAVGMNLLVHFQNGKIF